MGASVATDEAPDPTDVAAPPRASLRDAVRNGPTLATLVGLLFVLLGLAIGLGKLNDNSFMTHLATGRLILDNHHVPHSDPYSWSAPGHDWIVQSWLASIAFGIADRFWGPNGVVVLVGVTAATLAALMWTLTRPARSLLMRVLIMFAVIVLGSESWVERPYLFALVALALALLSAEGRLDPRWLVPVFFVWVNVHGSFPHGLVALALLAGGRRLDGHEPVAEWRALKWAAAGTLLGGIVNPYGPRLLLFPISLLSRQSVLQRVVVEWRAPSFEPMWQRAFLLEIVLVIISLIRRPSWRSGLIALVFIPAALLGTRNVVVAGLVLVPGMARGLAGIGELDGDERKSIFRPVAGLVCVLGLLLVSSTTSKPVYAIGDYPVAAVAWAEQTGLLDANTRMVTRDFGGNYVELRDGGRTKVFFDDRFDMYPESVIDDYETLLEGGQGWDDVLRRHRADLVIWNVDQPLGQLLASSPDWRIVYSDPQWLIAQPR